VHPLAWIGASSRPLWIWILLAVVAAGSVLLGRVGAGMRRSGGPGIVPFELAEDVREARRILTSWGVAGQAAARRSVLLDYGFLVAYSMLLALLSLYVADRADERGVTWLAVAGVVTAWLALVAGGLDAVENTALLRTLGGGPTAVSVRVAYRAAQLKFTLVAVCLLYFLLGLGLVSLAP
jgi:hypothetical protein